MSRCAIGLAILLHLVGPAAARQSQSAWDATLLDYWVTAVERHEGGSLDPTLVPAAAWSGDDLRKLWVDTQVLLEIAANPRRTRFRVKPRADQIDPRNPPAAEVTFQREDRSVLDALAARVRLVGVDATRRRAAIVHTDAVVVAPTLAASESPGTGAGASVRVHIGDGTALGTESVPLHWELARMLLDGIQPDPRQDAFVRGWYRATIAHSQFSEQFDSTHVQRALRLFGDDPELLLLGGCEREAFAAPLYQAFARSMRHTAMQPGIQSEETELDRAARLYRRALEARPDLGDARVRLGRVLGLQGRHADSLRELVRALDGPLEPVMEYYATLFVGAAHEALGNLPAARDAFNRALETAPGAHVPHLALARIALELGDGDQMAARLERGLADVGQDAARDPWWRYLSVQGRHAAEWLDQVRRASRSAQ